MLGKDSTRPPLAIGRMLPGARNLALCLFQSEVELQLFRRLSAQEQRLEYGFKHSVAVDGHRNAHAELFPNCVRLAQEHLQYGSIDAVVLAVQQRRPNVFTGLAVSVDATFALL